MKRVVHFYDSDTGRTLCRGLELAQIARPLDQNPPGITIYPGEVTCELCRTAWARRLARRTAA